MDEVKGPAIETVKNIIEEVKRFLQEQEPHSDLVFELVVGILEVAVLTGRSLGMDPLSLAVMFTEVLNHSEDAIHQHLQSSTTEIPESPAPVETPRVERPITEAQMREIRAHLKSGGGRHAN